MSSLVAAFFMVAGLVAWKLALALVGFRLETKCQLKFARRLGVGDGNSNRSHFDVIPIPKQIWPEIIQIEKTFWLERVETKSFSGCKFPSWKI